jgi:hypothetical protein
MEKIRWLGSPVFQVWVEQPNGEREACQACDHDIIIGLREDGVVVWERR